MKKFKLAFTLLLIPALLLAQENTFEFNQSRFNHYKKMKTTGVALIITGVALNAVGIPLYINGLKDSEQSSDFPEAAGEFGKTIGGIALIALGEVALAGGITLVVIGNKKAKQYEQLIKNEQKELSLNMTEQGLTLRFNF